MVNTSKPPASTTAAYLFLLLGIAKRNSISNPLAKLVNHQARPPKGRILFLACITAAVATSPPLGPVVVIVIVTGTAASLRFTVDGLKLRLMPDGAREGCELRVTVLGVPDSGVTFTVTVWI